MMPLDPHDIWELAVYRFPDGDRKAIRVTETFVDWVPVYEPEPVPKPRRRRKTPVPADLRQFQQRPEGYHYTSELRRFAASALTEVGRRGS